MSTSQVIENVIARVTEEKTTLDENATRLDALLTRFREDANAANEMGVSVLEQDLLYRQLRTQRELSAILGQRLDILKGKLQNALKEESVQQPNSES